MEEIIDNLLNSNCIKEGYFKLRNGEYSKFYFDMKNLVSHPTLLSKIGDKIYNDFIKNQITISKNNNTDIRICGVPLGGLPIASYISTTYNIPMIMLRTTVKNYGTQKQIEGEYKETDNCIIIEDVITTGSSVKESIDILKNKINIIGVCCILNRSNINCVNDINLYSLINKPDIIKNKLKRIIKIKNTRLCFSADIEDPNKIIEILNKIGKYIAICKIHFDIFKFIDSNHFNSFKKELINLSNNNNFLLMEDRKFFDISYIVEKQYEPFKEWIDLVTVHGLVNNEVLQKITCGVLLVSDMSNNNYNIIDKCIDLSNNNNNVLGLITQSNIKYENLMNFTPGISFNDVNINDQKYRNIGSFNKTNLPDIIIVGRAIYNSKDVLLTVNQLNEKIN
jgi:uridine monophosphate synthetase